MTDAPHLAHGLPAIGATHRSLREQVAEVIRQRIVSGDMPPNTRLIERTLAEELGVSRVPVRDALNLLKGEGFVTEVPRRGVVVTQMSRHDVEELFDVREALEVLSVRLATARATPEELVSLEAVLDDAQAAISTEDKVGVGWCNQTFHDAITTIAHNSLLASILEPLQGRLHWLLRQNDDPMVLHMEHVELYDAIASGDVEEATRVSLKHINTSRTICHDLLYGDDRRG